MEEEELIFKVVIIGDPFVGKSGILERFTKNSFNDNTKSTIGVSYVNYTTNINNKRVTIAIWDTVILY